jgi:uncharacterized protein (TIGR00288 family)
MTAQFARSPFRGRTAGGPPSEPHAALLIDFDNVTMGIRSDLTKELKNLLNSDIIKGKVAVQRAYADWRRYPQYIVPLAESSVDLIFAPAYGSAKKNATDIRLAIDAVELVFTRPEIGTIILLSGDSDFSSLVLKLKEYGKYVIGVGIRESASDLLVQNCDEYYSYSALTGLTRAGDEPPVVSEDPWELVEIALRQMIENDDVMRSDRLKQVILEMDPGFDEKTLGFQKFNKFLQEAAGRGLLSLRKQENGQFEVGPPGAEGADAAPRSESREAREGREIREGRSRRGRRGRGRRDEGREPREAGAPQLELAGAPDMLEEDEAPAAVASTEARAAEADVAAEAAAPEAAAAPARSRRGPARAPAAAEVDDAPAGDMADESVDGATAASADGAPAAGDLRRSYDLLRRAMKEMTRKGGAAVRDSDVKRRMLELEPGWDEASVGFSKFSRFLRKAHDDQVVTVRKADNGSLDVLLGDGGMQLDEPREERGGRRDRGGRDRGRRDREERGDVRRDEGSSDAAPAAAAAPRAPDSAQPAASAPAATAVAAPAAAVAAAPAPVGFRRGSRGRPLSGGPPPLLEGQTVGNLTATPASSRTSPPAAPAAAAPAAEPEAPAAAPAAQAPDAAEPAARGGRRGRGAEGEKESARQPAKAPSKQAPAKAGSAKSDSAKSDAAKSAPAKSAPAKAPARAEPGKAAPAAPAARGAKAAPARSTGFDAAAFGLPTSPDAISEYITTEYKGIGPKTVETLADRVGAAKVFEALETKPDLVREVLGGTRGEKLLEAWADDIAFRRANAAPNSQSTVRSAEGKGGRGGAARGGSRPGGAKKGPAKAGGAARGGGRRGGARRGGPGK